MWEVAVANRLANESSPYLKQHADNPVDWYPWSEEAFVRAQQENKPIHLSVGYAACHWCHVMAHESFENPEIAALLNENFINIKVDRQERPDIDDIYQKVVQMQGQGGGWPLTVFMTPAKEPFYGGTYFPPEDRYGRPGLPHLIALLSDAWNNHKQEIKSNVKQYLQGYNALDAQLLAESQAIEGDIPAQAAHYLAKNTDSVHGSFNGTPKFPNPVCYDFVLRVSHRTRDIALLNALTLTLDRMARGGIFDHLGGGFSRYSVDEQWAVPHFEKMLYDNAQLIKLYADAYRLTGKLQWRRTFEQTINYVLRDLTHREGGFFASEDADSEGKEGKFYVWTPAEIRKILGEEDGEFVCAAYGVTNKGNFEHGTTVPYRSRNLSPQEEARLEPLREKLLIARMKRTRPGRDENILTSWNALMIQGLCAAYQATGLNAYLDHAKRAAHFIQMHLTAPDGKCYRSWNNGEAKISGFLEDYAFLTNALLDLYESSFEKYYLGRAIELIDIILKDFWDNGLYMTAINGEKMIHRPRASYDSAWPSGTSMATFALLRLFAMLGNGKYLEYANRILKMYEAAASKNPYGFAHLLAAKEFSEQEPLEIIFAGNRQQVKELAQAVYRLYLPNRVIAFATDTSKEQGSYSTATETAAYICHQQTCAVPIMTYDALLEFLKPKV